MNWLKMEKRIIAILIIVVSILAIMVSYLFLRNTNKDYGVKKRIETWSAQIEKAKKTEQKECQLELSSLGDTLAFEMKNVQEEGDNYDATFLYPEFEEQKTELRQFNREIKRMVFDGFPSSKKYFSNFEQEYREAFSSIKEDEKYNWHDMEEIELIINSNKIISAIHHDFELKSGGAIWFGDRIGFNFDLDRQQKITFEELFDESKLDILQSELKQSYKEQFDIDSLEKNGWDKEEIPITKNFYLDRKGINFIYQRFEYNGIGAGGLDIKISYCEIVNLLIENSEIRMKLK